MTHNGLVVFDVDGTLIREKTVCEVIAQKIDKVERMDWLERNAGSVQKETNVPPNDLVIASRIEMADWYIDAGRETVDSFIDSVNWAVGAHAGITALIENNWLVAIASLTWSFGVEKIASELGVTESLGTGLDWNTKEIDHIFPEHKAEFLQQLATKYEIPSDRIYAVGDSGGDVPMLKAATRGFFLGKSDPQIPGVTHLPDAGIDTIAHSILNHEN